MGAKGKRMLRHITDRYYESQKTFLNKVKTTYPQMGQNQLDQLEEDYDKWSNFSWWLIECLKGKPGKIETVSMMGEVMDVTILSELSDAINFEKLKSYSSESKVNIIKRIEKNLQHEMCFKVPFTSKASYNSEKKGQWRLQKLNTIFWNTYVNVLQFGPDFGFSKNEFRSLQNVFEWITRPPTNDQRTEIRKNVGIGPHWNKNLCWDYLECHTKIHGIVPSVNNQEERIKSIESCIDALINAIKKEEITFDRVKQLNGKEDITPGASEINLLTKNAKDLLCKKLFDKKIFGKPLENFSRALEQHLENECISNFKRLSKETVDSLYEKLEETQTSWGKIEYLFKEEGKLWKSRGIEGQKLEFKESFFHDEKRSKDEFDDWTCLLKKKVDKKKRTQKEIAELDKKIMKHEKEMAKQYKIFKKPEKYEDFSEQKQNFVEHRILKNVCSFINTDGGRVIIGASDDGTLIGLDRDCKHEKFEIKDQRKFIDKIKKQWIAKIKGESGFEDYQNYIKQTEIPIKDSKKWIYLIEIGSVPDPWAYLKDGKNSTFYIRDDGDGTVAKDYESFKKWKRHRKDFHKN